MTQDDTYSGTTGQDSRTSGNASGGAPTQPLNFATQPTNGYAAPAGGSSIPPQTPGQPPMQMPGQMPPVVPVQKKTSKLAVAGVIFAALYLVMALLTSDWEVGGIIMGAVLPVLFSGGALYATRKNGKVDGRIIAYVAVGLTVVAIVVSCAKMVMASSAERAESCGDYSWPSSGIAERLPKPESTKGEIGIDSEGSFDIDVCDVTDAQFKSYVEQVKKSGFTVDYTADGTSYSGKDDEGYGVTLYHDQDDDTLSISIFSPEASKGSGSDDTSDDGADASSDSDGKDSTGNDAGDAKSDTGSSQTDTSGVSPDFKATMDSYEEFFNKYVDFMKKYDSEGQPISMLKDYTDMLSQYNDMIQKMDAIDENSMSDADLQYYLEVQGRVTQKLAEVPTE